MQEPQTDHQAQKSWEFKWRNNARLKKASIHTYMHAASTLFSNQINCVVNRSKKETNIKSHCLQDNDDVLLQWWLLLLMPAQAYLPVFLFHTQQYKNCWCMHMGVIGVEYWSRIVSILHVFTWFAWWFVANHDLLIIRTSIFVSCHGNLLNLGCGHHVWVTGLAAQNPGNNSSKKGDSKKPL